MFGAVSLTKNANIDQYKYSGYRISFDRKRQFSFGNGFGKNCIIFGEDSVYVDNKKEDILILGQKSTQELDATTLIAEKLYAINYTENNKKII